MLTEQEQQALFKWISKSKLSVSRKAFEMSAETKYPEKRLNYWMGVDLYAQAKEADKESLTVEEIAAAYVNLSYADKESIAFGWRAIKKDVYTPIVQSSEPPAVLTDKNKVQKVQEDLFSPLNNYLLTNKNGIYELLSYLTDVAGLKEEIAGNILSFLKKDNLTEDNIMTIVNTLYLQFNNACLEFYYIVSNPNYAAAREIFSGVDLTSKDPQQKTVADKLVASFFGEGLIADDTSEEDLAKKLDSYKKGSDIIAHEDRKFFESAANYALFNCKYKQKTDVAAAAVYNHGSIRNELLIIARMEQFCRIADALQPKKNSLVKDFIARITPANLAEVRKELKGLEKLGYSNIQCSVYIENKCKEIEKGINKQQSGVFSIARVASKRLFSPTSPSTSTEGTLSPSRSPEILGSTIKKTENTADKGTVQPILPSTNEKTKTDKGKRR